jgi:hypothetical protein
VPLGLAELGDAVSCLVCWLVIELFLVPTLRYILRGEQVFLVVYVM